MFIPEDGRIANIFVDTEEKYQRNQKISDIFLLIPYPEYEVKISSRTYAAGYYTA
jgi:hypothetical protein